MPHGWAKRQREEQLRRLVRERIISGIHSGRLDTGDRLPTYREIAEETGADLRAVARVYRELVKEGLVEIRGRSGVFVARQEHLGGRVLAETARWMIQVLSGARTRHIRIPEFPDFVRRCIGATTVRCVCVESTEDQLSAICDELKRDFGLHSVPVPADRLVPRQDGSAQTGEVLEELREADFLVTSTYHAADLRPLAAALEKPLVVFRLNPEMIRRLQRTLSEGEVTVVHVDPHFAERIRRLAGEHAERIRSVLARDRRAIQRMDRSRPVLVSPAARTVLRDGELPSSFLRGQMISSESADEIIELLIRFNLEAMREES